MQWWNLSVLRQFQNEECKLNQQFQFWIRVVCVSFDLCICLMEHGQEQHEFRLQIVQVKLGSNWLILHC